MSQSGTWLCTHCRPAATVTGRLCTHHTPECTAWCLLRCVLLHYQYSSYRHALATYAVLLTAYALFVGLHTSQCCSHPGPRACAGVCPTALCRPVLILEGHFAHLIGLLADSQGSASALTTWLAAKLEASVYTQLNCLVTSTSQEDKLGQVWAQVSDSRPGKIILNVADHIG